MNLEDIALKAGVSRSTVSRVINGKGYVSAETRDRVLKVIEEEKFAPHPGARILATQRSHIIGIVIPHIFMAVFEGADSLYFPTLVQGITDAAQRRDYAAMLWIISDMKDQDRLYKRILQNRLVEGVILASANIDECPLIDRMLENDLPFVTLERPVNFGKPISSVSVDNVRAAQDAVEHLIDLGRRRIGTVTGTLKVSDGIDRLEGYKAALKEAGVPVDPALIFEGMFSQMSGYEGAKQLLERGVDAIFAANDATAIGVLQALLDAGVRIPDDVALVGFDDLPMSARCVPPLTTVRQPVTQKGAQGTELLIDLIEGRVQGPCQLTLPTELVIRESSGGRR